MANKMRASARRKASRPESGALGIDPSGVELPPLLRMALVATLKDLSGVELPPDTRVALIPATPGGFEQIRIAIGPARGSDVREFAAVGTAAPVVGARPSKAPAVNPSAFSPDARSRAILDGVRIAQQDLEDAGGAFDLEQVRTLLRGVSRQAIDRRVQEGSLLAVPGPSNHRSFPTLQFNRDGSLVSGLKAVLEALPVESPWAVLNFLVNPDPRLDGRKPIDVLRTGDVAQVVEAARLYGEPAG